MITQYIQSQITRVQQTLVVYMKELKELRKERETIAKGMNDAKPIAVHKFDNDRYDQLNTIEIYLKAKIDTLRNELELLAQDLRFYTHVKGEF